MLKNDIVNRLLAEYGCLVDCRASAGLPPEGHAHDGIELGVLHSGTALYATSNWNRTVAATTGILFDAQSTHYVRSIDKRFVRTCVTFLPEFIADQELIDRLGHMKNEKQPHYFSITADVAHRFSWVTNELMAMSRRGTSQRLRARLLEAILLDLYEQQADRPLIPSTIAHAVEQMRSHVAGQISVSELAKRLHYSESQFRHVFRLYTGYSPQAYWNRLKIEHACGLLKGSMKVSDVAANVGFDSLSGFQRAFKRVTGLSPTQYRETAAPLPFGDAL